MAPPVKKLPLGRKLGFLAVFVALSLGFAVIALLALDLWLHHRYDGISTPNRRGYRGAIVGKKQPGELRLVVVGGSTAYGYGVRPADAFPAYLEAELRQSLKRPVTVVNLAYNVQGSYSFLPTLKDYADLDYDGVVMYEGYNDLIAPNTSLFRHDSPVFRAIGYYPITPIILAEKAHVLKGERISDVQDGQRVRFNPNAADRTKVAMIDSAMRINAALDRQLAGAEHKRIAPGSLHSADCSDEWAFYCNCIHDAVDYASSRGKKVFVVTQPYISPSHREQQRELSNMLRNRFGGRGNVVYVNLGDAVDLHDSSLTYDGMHLVPAGNRLIAQRLAQPIAAAFSSNR